MILEIRNEKSNSNRSKTKLVCDLSCDSCNIQFIGCGPKHTRKEFHFCSKKCRYDAMKVNGVLNNKMRSRNLEKYGVEYTTQLETTKLKSQETSLERYGVINPGTSEISKEKRKQTNLRRYGVENVLASPKIRKKSQETIITKYGDDKKIIIEKMKATNLERHGVECTLHAPEIAKAVADKIYARYGVTNVGQSEEVKNKIKNTMLERYGVNSALELASTRKKAWGKEARAKAHRTMKKNKSYGKSKIEDKFYETLLKYFNDIERNKLVNNDLWPIDFYIKFLDAYIQFDGVYWHGLDRSLKEIKKFKSDRDKVIYRKHCTDREQDEWFKKNNMKLVRITDQQFKNNEHTTILEEW